MIYNSNAGYACGACMYCIYNVVCAEPPVRVGYAAYRAFARACPITKLYVALLCNATRIRTASWHTCGSEKVNDILHTINV